MGLIFGLSAQISGSARADSSSKLSPSPRPRTDPADRRLRLRPRCCSLRPIGSEHHGRGRAAAATRHCAGLLVRHRLRKVRHSLLEREAREGCEDVLGHLLQAPPRGQGSSSRIDTTWIKNGEIFCVQCRLVEELETQSFRCFLHIQIYSFMPVIFLHELLTWSRWIVAGCTVLVRTNGTLMV
ncbi:uncharacterized protein LOC133904480 [Phragmites australis]|uniref:uncharacterized protein LOC133904480 n=1 Tax=Phragmites australis TaxID=29695 RepID=UPI002D78872F|nr:uncharacterized protein LOC133904480 [Phragmites australis]